MILIKRNLELTTLVLTTALAIVFAYTLYLQGGQGLFFDALGYYELGRTIAEQGLMAFSSDTRTYGYPLFVALSWLLTDHSSSMAHFVIFNAQLLVFVIACVYAARKIRALKGSLFATAFYASVVLNPLLLIYTTVVLADLLSAVLIFLAVLLSVGQVCSPNDPASSRAYCARAFMAFGLIGFSVMVRPANLAIVFAVAVIWLARTISDKSFSWRVVIFAVLGLTIPFIPQIVFNWRDYNRIQPLIENDLYSYQMLIGIKVLKYSTLAIPGEPSSVPYFNPFLPANISSPIEFLTQQPVGYALTLGSHLFAFFDQDFPFPYIVDLRPWYRWWISIANYSFLFFSLVGVWVGVAQFWKRKRFDATGFFFGGLLLTALAYLPLYLFTAVENRFALPEYLLLSPFFVFGLQRSLATVTNRRWNLSMSLIALLCVFLVASINLSMWLQHQSAGDLLGRSELLDAKMQMMTYPVNVRFGERIQLQGFSIKSSRSVQGGDSIWLTLGWKCNGASTDPYDIQVSLEDDRNHVWVQGLRFADAPVNPCPSRFWEPRLENGDVLSFKLSPGIPSGTYRITVALSNRNENESVHAFDSFGKEIGDKIILTTLPIAKNTSSIEANQLTIEQPLFVDMGEIRFLGYIPVAPIAVRSQILDMRFYWRARGKPKGDYSVVVQFLSKDGHVGFEQSSRPVAGNYPTSVWNVGEVLLDWHDVQVPSDMPLGRYQLVVQLRDDSAQRVLGQVDLQQIEIR